MIRYCRELHIRIEEGIINEARRLVLGFGTAWYTVLHYIGWYSVCIGPVGWVWQWLNTYILDG